MANDLTATRNFRLIRGKALGYLALANLPVRRFSLAIDLIDEAVDIDTRTGKTLDIGCRRGWQRVIRERQVYRRVLL
ncbi:hypothetical protein [Nocardia terpenica]|uniref:Uncharacterized protein n=1 Tax=Nocardia terpenica TaxID=455432 RepID=A0A6G9YXY3_9NOCA|nr:hypothetical protein [Nocardia terpenica]QIS17683.1 hypothetical protein F6W96_04530 [Nocardia terpenica]